jgi:hypothetical protein
MCVESNKYLVDVALTVNDRWSRSRVTSVMGVVDGVGELVDVGRSVLTQVLSLSHTLTSAVKRELKILEQNKATRERMNQSVTNRTSE